jgi:hypothetical protein
MECPECGTTFADEQLEALVLRGYHELFLGLHEGGKQTAVTHELDAANRRCEKRNGCSWATYLEQLWRNGLFVFEDAQVLMHNSMQRGMIYLGLRGLGHDAIAEVYCTDKETVSRILKRTGSKIKTI